MNCSTAAARKGKTSAIFIDATRRDVSTPCAISIAIRISQRKQGCITPRRRMTPAGAARSLTQADVLYRRAYGRRIRQRKIRTILTLHRTWRMTDEDEVAVFSMTMPPTLRATTPDIVYGNWLAAKSCHVHFG